MRPIGSRLLVGAVLARGRRTVTSWIRAAGLSDEYRRCYTTVDAVGTRTDHLSAPCDARLDTQQSNDIAGLQRNLLDLRLRERIADRGVLRIHHCDLGGHVHHAGHLSDFLPADAWTVLVEPDDLHEQGKHFLERVAETTGLFSIPAVFQQLLRFPSVKVTALPSPSAEATCHLRVESVERFSGDVKKLRAAKLCTEPFTYTIVPGFLDADSVKTVNATYPPISQGGSFPVASLTADMAIKESWSETVFENVPPPLIHEWTNPRYTFALVKDSALYRSLGYLSEFLFEEKIIPQPVDTDNLLDPTVVAEALKTYRPGR